MAYVADDHKGLLMAPLTKEACERHAPSSSSTAPPPPEPVLSNTDEKKTLRRRKACKNCKETQWRFGKEHCNPEGTAPAPPYTSELAGSGEAPGPSESVLLSPSKGKWIQNEVAQFQKSNFQAIKEDVE